MDFGEIEVLPDDVGTRAPQLAKGLVTVRRWFDPQSFGDGRGNDTLVGVVVLGARGTGEGTSGADADQAVGVWGKRVKRRGPAGAPLEPAPVDPGFVGRLRPEQVQEHSPSIGALPLIQCENPRAGAFAAYPQMCLG